MFTLAKLYINLNSAKKINKNKFTRFSQNMCKYLRNKRKLKFSYKCIKVRGLAFFLEKLRIKPFPRHAQGTWRTLKITANCFYGNSNL